MKIALIGYGKMGKTIEKIAMEQGHEIISRIDRKGAEDWHESELAGAQVAIEFTQPESAYSNILRCFSSNIPVVCGTTGWLEKFPEVRRICLDRKQSFFYASNYSIGVNIFFEVNKRLAELMNKREDYYKAFVHEYHHLQKLDAPSGTAISIAGQITGRIERFKKWKSYDSEENMNILKQESELPVVSTREGDVPGTHSVKYISDVDEIEIIHKAYNRNGFAKGALAAAIWLKDKKGCFGMEDLLSL